MKYRFVRKPPSPVRKPETQPIAEAIGNMLRSQNLEKRYLEAQIIASWNKLLGSAIASRTHKLFIRRTTLYAEVHSAPLKAELLMHKSHLINMLNQEARGVQASAKKAPPVIDDIFFI
jgi:hypothetical protein